VGDILLNVKLIVLEAQKAKYQSYSSDRTCALLDGMSFTVLFSEDVLKVIATLDSLVCWCAPSGLLNFAIVWST
jgi:hypothetical protein